MGELTIFQLIRTLSGICYSAGKKALKILDCEVEAAFIQSWPDTSCGFGGMAGQAVTGAFTVVLHEIPTGERHVFISGRHAYTVQYPSREFLEDVRAHNVRGAREGWHKRYETRKDTCG